MVHLDVNATGFNLYTTEFDVSEPVLKELAVLATFFIAHCEAKLVPLMAKFKDELKALGPGCYNVTPAEPPIPWIHRVPSLKSVG